MAGQVEWSKGCSVLSAAHEDCVSVEEFTRILATQQLLPAEHRSVVVSTSFYIPQEPKSKLGYEND
jgi:hypothetical protein